ncbi:MAG: hypothetical protein JW953_24005 [Anaerolineae bacterium]|nr:hypothetical protein [Anaerolineae bacterium]
MTLFKKFLPLLCLAALGLWLTGPAYAQDPPEGPLPTLDWQELPTEKFIIVYAQGVTLEGQPVDCPACGLAPAEYYATLVDEIYTDLAAVFNIELQTPLNLRLFPTEESYFQVNPLARESGGVVAHSMNDTEEIALALPRTEGWAEEDLTNNIRHEITHLFASALSNGKLNTGFQEGIAQYLEKPNEKTEKKQDLLRQAYEQQRLLTWAELDDAQKFYGDPQVAYPQAFSMVSFLIDRYGLANFITFIKTTANEPGYRSALESAYNIPADELEAEWLDYLPQYFDGRWQINAIYAYDLSRVIELVNKGAYTDAETELSAIITLLQTTEQTDTLAAAESLLTRIHQGHSAAAFADQSRAAIQAGNYVQAIELGHAAIAAYQQLGYLERIPEIQNHIHRANIGLEALDQLSQGEAMLNTLRFFEAEREIYQATVLLQSLGNQTAAQHGIELLQQSAQRQRMLAYALVTVGIAILLFNGLRRLFNRLSATPLEVELT